MSVKYESLTTLANARKALNLASGFTADDSYIELLIEAVTDAIQAKCGRKFVRRWYGDHADDSSTTVPTEDFFYVDGRGQTSIVLPTYPVVAGSVTLGYLSTRSNSGGATYETTTYLENEAFVVDELRGIIRLLSGGLVHGTKNYRVAFQAGYADQGTAPWVPYDLERAAIMMVVKAYRQSAQLTAQNTGSISRSYDLNFEDPLCEAVIKKYKTISNFV